MINEQPLERGQVPDDEFLRQRLAAVATGGNQPTTNGFRRRRSSGLLFQIRRRVRQLDTAIAPPP
jgi:hypothetical protein